MARRWLEEHNGIEEQLGQTGQCPENQGRSNRDALLFSVLALLHMGGIDSQQNEEVKREYGGNQGDQETRPGNDTPQYPDLFKTLV